ncbi:MAG: [FeFe] hydrogenase H-cluster radical SAM maturase HydE, partial [Bacteroidales bacterium]
MEKVDLSKEGLVGWLEETDEQRVKALLDSAYNIKAKNIGTKVFLRGLIELSNKCSKNCCYCGIRNANKSVARYELSEEQVLDAALFAWKANYGSLVLQAGERTSL